MSHLKKANREDSRQFKWGAKKKVDCTNNGLQFYESFMYKGQKYSLYDCVYLYHKDYLETSIGKLVEMSETLEHGKKVKVVWFLRPVDVSIFLNGYEPRWNEIFLVSGEGSGLSNNISLEKIIGKCNVVCASNDWRNPRASQEGLKKADYIFDRTFDAAKLKLDETFPEEVNGIKVEYFFNRKKVQKAITPRNSKVNVRELTQKLSSPKPRCGRTVLAVAKKRNLGIRRGNQAVKESERANVVPRGTSMLQLTTSIAQSEKKESLPENIDGVEERRNQKDKEDGQGCFKKITLRIKMTDPNGRGRKTLSKVIYVVKEPERAAVDVPRDVSMLGPTTSSGKRVKEASFAENINEVKESRKLKVNEDEQGCFKKPKIRIKFTDANSTFSELLSKKEDKGIVHPSLFKQKEKVIVNPRNSKANAKDRSGKSSSSARLGLDKAVGVEVKNSSCGIRVSSVVKGSEKSTIRQGQSSRPKTSDNKDKVGVGRISCSEVKIKAKVRSYEHIIPASTSVAAPRKRIKNRHDEKENDKVADEFVRNRGAKTGGLFWEVTRKPDSHKGSRFNPPSWEESLAKAREMGTVLSLENLDPSYTSSEVQDLVWHALGRQVKAKMLQRTTFSSNYSGKALVIFRSKVAADRAIVELKRRILMSKDGRPVVCRRPTLREPTEPASFPGHLNLDKVGRRKQCNRKMKNAVSTTSHSSKLHNMEYEMAMEWRYLQKKSVVW